MNKFLFELGTEEIPADLIAPALKRLQVSLEKGLEEDQLGWDAVEAYSTPRRLALVFTGLPERQPDREEWVSGPPKSVAFDEQGLLTKAAEGFAKKWGVDASTLTSIETERGEYLAVKRKLVGESTPTLLARALPAAIKSIDWPRSMYWRESRFRFIRPLRWFVVLWNDEIVPFEFEGVVSCRSTMGHRLLSAGEVSLPEVDAYVPRLMESFVVVGEQERRRRIQAGLEEALGSYQLVKDPGLLETVVQLNEFPSVIRGDFDEKFLSIPQEVLTTVMRFHQKYFAVANDSGALVPHFLTVINTSGDSEGSIRRGHEKVLRARLEDAAFFWTNDQKRTLSERREQLAQVLFQERLGSYLEKSERLRAICRKLGGDGDLDLAAQLCKSDLTCEMVREFPELQGVMGGLYARQEGLPETVWQAIYDHYRPVTLDDSLPRSRAGVLLSIADRIDTLVGCFGVGIVPTGSSDPFGLRRLAQGMVQALLESGLEFSPKDLVSWALENFTHLELSSDMQARTVDFLMQRVDFLFERQGIPSGVIKAVLAVPQLSISDALRRAEALVKIQKDPDFEALAVAFKRTRNILRGVESRGRVDPNLLVDGEEKALYQLVLETRPEVETYHARGDYEAALRSIARMRSAIDLFFDRVLVMADQVDLRNNRLGLLNEISELFMSVADISKITQER
jgi:glycyl-tRNA synthetase beta chain